MGLIGLRRAGLRLRFGPLGGRRGLGRGGAPHRVVAARIDKARSLARFMSRSLACSAIALRPLAEGHMAPGALPRLCPNYTDW